MKIGIDARMINASGIGRYIKNLIEGLQKIDKKNEYIIFLLKEDFENLKFQNNFKKVLAEYIWYGYKEQTIFVKLLNSFKFDLVHFPHLNVPIFYRGKFVVTIHDLTHVDFKMIRASAHNRIYYEVKHQVHKLVMYSALIRSQKIITPSNFVKEEIVSRYNIKPDKVAVTLEAVDTKFITTVIKMRPISTKRDLDKFGIKPPYLFYAGNAHPHKNVEGLIKAFIALRKKYQYLQLVLSGREDFFWKRLRNEVNQRDIVFTGFVTDQQLAMLYKNAQAFCFPSFSEGFGIPILEAMACKTPVICSNRTSLPEVGGNAAIYFDPDNLDDMVVKISKVLNDQKLRKELIAKGGKRVRQFSWEKMVQQTLDIYQNITQP